MLVPMALMSLYIIMIAITQLKHNVMMQSVRVFGMREKTAKQQIVVS